VEKGVAHGPVFELIVDDVQAVKRKLLAEGCTVVEEDASAPRCYVRDPHGFTFNLGQR
jgi:predicted enzyme related to lactoylglutathione lyase